MFVCALHSNKIQGRWRHDAFHPPGVSPCGICLRHRQMSDPPSASTRRGPIILTFNTQNGGGRKHVPSHKKNKTCSAVQKNISQQTSYANMCCPHCTDMDNHIGICRLGSRMCCFSIDLCGFGCRRPVGCLSFSIFDKILKMSTLLFLGHFIKGVGSSGKDDLQSYFIFFT